MTWTYSTADLATSEKDQIRLEIQDTDSTAPLLQDEEITRVIAVEANFWGSCARCCEMVARLLLRKADVRIGRGGTSVMYATAAKQYEQMAQAFRKRAIGMNPPWAGGTSKSAKSSLAQDTDSVQPIFTKTMQNSSFVGGEGSDSVINDAQLANQ